MAKAKQMTIKVADRPGSVAEAIRALAGAKVSSGTHHELTFKRASKMESDEASCNSRLPVAGAAGESLV